MRLRIEFPTSRLGFRRDSDYPIQERIIVVRLEIEPCVRIASTVSVICSARD
ncbi:hypothetical protein HanIR_Chr13g0630611 [Helianthus annuus]|nr:hypothetical protein HanIR_Chr13g0630611 [Helianthus annuus]